MPTNLKTTTKVHYLSTQRCQISEIGLKAPRLRPLVLPIIETCKRRCMWGVSGIILTGETELHGL